MTSYNPHIPDRRARTTARRTSWPTSSLLLTVSLLTILLSTAAFASSLADTARQLAHKIAAESGPGAVALDITNRSSLDEKSFREIRTALEAELHSQGVESVKPEQSMGSVTVVLSESLSAYVWTAQIAIGSDDRKVALVSMPRSATTALTAPSLPVVLKATLLFTQHQPMHDIATLEMPGGSRLLVLNNDTVTIYRQQGSNAAPRWQLEASLPIAHSRPFPRDLSGRLLLRRDHLFDLYMPGTFCRSTSTPSAPLALACNSASDSTAAAAASAINDSTYNEPWPLTPDDNSVRAFFASSRNFFTGALSPPIGKVSTVSAFYSAASLPRANYTLWAFAAVDGSLHLVDGITDQLIRGTGVEIRSGSGINTGSDLAALRSNCGAGTQLLVTAGDGGSTERDSVRAFEIPDRDLVPVSSPIEFDGQIIALWPNTAGTTAVAITKRNANDAEEYEAYTIQISCGS